MKNIANILFLLPVLLYVILIIINKDILSIREPINFFWIADIKAYLIWDISIFFVLYLLIIWLGLKFSDIFNSFKSKKHEKIINKLKAELQDKEPELLSNIEDRFEKVIEKFKEENNKNIKILKKENEKILSNLEYDIKTIKEKIDKIK